jgi:hypothetical protein
MAAGRNNAGLRAEWPCPTFWEMVEARTRGLRVLGVTGEPFATSRIRAWCFARPHPPYPAKMSEYNELPNNGNDFGGVHLRDHRGTCSTFSLKAWRAPSGAQQNHFYRCLTQHLFAQSSLWIAD